LPKRPTNLLSPLRFVINTEIVMWQSSSIVMVWPTATLFALTSAFQSASAQFMRSWKVSIAQYHFSPLPVAPAFRRRFPNLHMTSSAGGRATRIPTTAMRASIDICILRPDIRLQYGAVKSGTDLRRLLLWKSPESGNFHWYECGVALPSIWHPRMSAT
jgi:hypothetical protein